MDATRRFLEQMGLPPGDLHSLPSSAKRFPDGAQYRIEIPSTESPIALAAIIQVAERYSLTIHHVSQGSGVMLLTDDEIREMTRRVQAFIALSRERVRRARIELDLLARYYSDAIQSKAGAPGLAIPVQEETL
jgi:hypothetical protein